MKIAKGRFIPVTGGEFEIVNTSRLHVTVVYFGKADMKNEQLEELADKIKDDIDERYVYILKEDGEHLGWKVGELRYFKIIPFRLV